MKTATVSAVPFGIAIPDSTAPDVRDYFNMKKQQSIPYPEVAVIDNEKLFGAVPTLTVSGSEGNRTLVRLVGQLGDIPREENVWISAPGTERKTVRSVEDIPVPEKPDFSGVMDSILAKVRSES